MRLLFALTAAVCALLGASASWAQGRVSSAEGWVPGRCDATPMPVLSQSLPPSVPGAVVTVVPSGSGSMADAAFHKSSAKTPRLVSELGPREPQIPPGAALGRLRRQVQLELLQSLPPNRCVDPTQPGCSVEEPGPAPGNGPGVWQAELVVPLVGFQGIAPAVGCVERAWPPAEASLGRAGVRALPWRPPAP